MANKRRLLTTAALIGVLAGIGILYAMVDPMQAPWMPKCLCLEMTGWRCPGCGSQRVAHALLTGDLAAAWSANPFLVAMLPVIVFLIVVELLRRRKPRLYAAVFSPTAIYLTLIVIIAWTIARNLLDL